MQLLRGVLDALLPPGSLWVPEDDGDFDLLLEGMAENHEAVRAYLSTLAYIRSPLLTSLLDDLEREFGIEPSSLLDEATRRARLLAVKADRSGSGSVAFIEQQLRAAGFDVYVHSNDPATNPSNFLYDGSAIVLGNEKAIFGHENTVFTGGAQGLIVNGDDRDILYAVPPAGYWGLVFFIGGAATRDGDGYITGIAAAQVPSVRKDEFTRLVARYKPLHAWGALTVDYI